MKITVTMIDCVENKGALPKPPMDNEPWQRRAKLAGLSQKMLARLLGVTENTVSLQLRGKWQTGETPFYVKTVIMAWERLHPQAREELLEAADAELERREKEQR